VLLNNRIAVNTRVLSKPNMGIRRYVEELMRRFGTKVDSISPHSSLDGVRAHAWEQFILPGKLNGRLLWSPTGLGPLIVKNQVLTVQDVSFLDHPEWYSKKFSTWYGWLIPRLVRQVSHVITSSNYSKESILRNIDVDANKLSVVPLGVDTRVFYPRPVEEIESVKRILEIPSANYVLSFGTLEPRKNLPRLIEAWGRMQDKVISQDTWLVIAGAKGKDTVFKDVDLSRLPPRVFLTGYVADQHLPALYSGSIASAYVSLYEGFGFPPLESMATGTPTLTSNVTSLPEVVGPAGIMVNPYKIEDIADGLLRLITDKVMREDLRQKGFERVKGFTWDQCAESTLAILDRSANIMN
jgi:glycosyltransferase involved in cell wall biosynthesis